MSAALIVVLLMLAPVVGFAAEYTIGPVPAWVIPTTPGTASANQADRGSDGVAYLLTDTQVLAGAQRVMYRRVVSTALNAGGVDSVANIEITFDPSYQKLVLHSINIVRHGQVIPKLATAKIQLLQRETELETRIYDGSKTVSVFLDDVRVGDTIDYAFSRIGRNPVFQGRDFGTMSLQFGIPVARVHARLLVPLDRHPTIALHNAAIKPVVSEHDGLRDHVWDVVDPPVLSVETGTPDWYSPYAEVEWSEFADWSAVARWAQPLYQVPDTLDPSLQAQVERIAKAERTPADRMLAALRLVQGEIRYLGVEIGQNSHAPNPPALVFARRFGDCKDKTLLTLTLLKYLGVDAHAALVNTRLQRGIADGLPNPGAFDHVLVQARVDGKTWWIDPTRYTQNADLAHLFQPDYGPTLIVDSATQGLSAMRHAAPGDSGSDLRVKFDASAGFDKPVRYTVETTSRGDVAESLRGTLSSTNLADLQKKYLNFYANYYPHIAVAAPLQIHDDEANNLVTTHETYTLADMSLPSDDGTGYVAAIHLGDIVQALRDPEVSIRKSPLQLAYPHDVSQRTEVVLPEDWPTKLHTTTIEDPAFRFVQTVTKAGQHLIITDHFQALTDEVAAKDMTRYLGNLARARDIAGYQFSWGKPAAATSKSASGMDRMNWPVAMLALGMIGLFGWLAVLAFRYDPPPAYESDMDWAGIGGWLLLLVVVLALRPLVYATALVPLAGVMSADTWSSLTTYGSSTYNAMWAPLLLFELAANLAQLALSLLLLVLFFKRRSSFPRTAVLLFVVAIVLQAGDLLLSGLVPGTKTKPDDISKAVGSAVGAGIWIAYLLSSRRVRATFVRRYRVSAPPPLPGLGTHPGVSELAQAQVTGAAD
ncbi:MAG: DUF3857 domain-containing protein [Rhodanobacter sp.]